jgi:hydroxymethylbilane synthase
VTLRIGTRGSLLARTQSALVGDALRNAAGDGLDVEYVEMVTHGDLSRGSLVGLSEAGVFVTALRESLLADECDLIVHSLKDMPVAPFEGLQLAAIVARADPRDALCGGGHTLAELPSGARIGTSSPRRKAQVLALRPDVTVLDIRGNVDTRLSHIGGEYDAVVLALAGLARLGREDEADQVFDVDAMVPAPGQGALAIEIRADAPGPVQSLVAGLDDFSTRACVTAERAALEILEAGCAAPVGIHAITRDGKVHVHGRVIDGSGRLALNEHGSGPVAHAAAVGRSVAHELLGRGAKRLMAASGT